MKNNVLSAFVVFFAVVACLLIIDDLTHGMDSSMQKDDVVNSKIDSTSSENLVTLDLEAND